MKKKLSFKERFHKYMCTLEDRGFWDPLFVVYLIGEALRITVLVSIIWLIYKFSKEYILWVLK